jgi:putative ABC transport system permease protein
MKPFSALKYFSENKKRAVTVFAVLVLSVAVVSFVTSLIVSIGIDATKTQLDVFQSMSYVTAASNEVFISDDVLKKIEDIAEVDKVYDVSLHFTSLDTLVLPIGAPVVIPDEPSDISEMMNRVQLTLTEGRLPAGDDFEIVLHERLMTNKGLKTGDSIGYDVNDSDYLPGNYKIVGVLSGDAIMAFANKSVIKESYREAGMILDKPGTRVLFPKENQLKQMNEKLGAITKKEADVRSYDILKKMLDENLASLNVMLTIVIFAVVTIISISVGALIYIVYMNRNEEFGILAAMGYRKSFISRLVLKELIALSVFCWVFGYLFSWGLLALINKALLEPKGQFLYFFTQEGFMNTLIIPVMVIICSTIPILRKLRKWDPIAVIERRE